MNREELFDIIRQFRLEGTVQEVKPLGSGLINDTFLVTTAEAEAPDYVLQRINHAIFTDVDMLQHNIEAVTRHLRQKLEAEGCTDIRRHVMQFVSTRAADGKTYHFDGQSYWRVSVFIPNSMTLSEVTPATSYDAGRAFGHFEQQLTDLPEKLGETIPDFHNMELRLRQLREAVSRNAAGRVDTVREELAMIDQYADEMCQAERLHREGLLPKRICHCDTKVNNMLFDADGDAGEKGTSVLCVIDLDTVMPSYIFSDYGDFLRTAANTVAEDSPEYERIAFRWDIYEAFTRGYLESARSFLTPVETEHLPFAVALFPMMQAVRFLADYLNGDVYYKTSYPDHNLVRTRNQLRYFQCVKARQDDMASLIIA
ncbi:MAG: aminoglycoside phosphotransferase family protein [Prevotella sp.]|nr:aminoglycoside phosphotransferase family protein [Prevotella sp.]